MRVMLGDECQDMVSGFRGIATSRTEWLNGCSIRWTSNTEAIQVTASELELAAARVAAVDLQLKVRAHRQLRDRVTASLNQEEAQLGQRLTNALNVAQARHRTVMAIVGYDLEAGEVVLADQAKVEIARRPLSESERLIAEKMPDPT